MGNSEFLLSCNGELWIRLMSLQGNQAILEWRWENRGSSLAVVGKSVILLSCDGNLGGLLELQQGHHASSQVEIGNSGFLSSCQRGVGPPSS